jgi:predicted Zn-dependent protease
MTRREKLEEMLKANPGDVFLHYARACELAGEGLHHDAWQAFTRLHEQFPDYVPGWFKHAQLAYEADRVDEARRLAETGLETARRVGDQHAAGELQQFLDLL